MKNNFLVLFTCFLTAFTQAKAQPFLGFHDFLSESNAGMLFKKNGDVVILNFVRLSTSLNVLHARVFDQEGTLKTDRIVEPEVNRLPYFSIGLVELEDGSVIFNCFETDCSFGSVLYRITAYTPDFSDVKWEQTIDPTTPTPFLGLLNCLNRNKSRLLNIGSYRLNHYDAETGVFLDSVLLDTSQYKITVNHAIAHPTQDSLMLVAGYVPNSELSLYEVNIYNGFVRRVIQDFPILRFFPIPDGLHVGAVHYQGVMKIDTDYHFIDMNPTGYSSAAEYVTDSLLYIYDYPTSKIYAVDYDAPGQAVKSYPINTELYDYTHFFMSKGKVVVIQLNRGSNNCTGYDGDGWGGMNVFPLDQDGNPAGEFARLNIFGMQVDQATSYANTELDARIQGARVQVKNESAFPIQRFRLFSTFYYREDPNCAGSALNFSRDFEQTLLPGQVVEIELGDFAIPQIAALETSFCFRAVNLEYFPELPTIEPCACLPDSTIRRLKHRERFELLTTIVQDEIILTLPIQGLWGGRFQIYNIAGQLIFNDLVVAKDDFYFIDVSRLPSGVYLITDGESTSRFVKI